MFTVARLAVRIGGSFVLILLILPLVQFTTDLLMDPAHLIMINFPEITLINETYARITILVIYNGSVPLKDFRIRAFGQEILLGDIERGNNSRTYVIPITKLTYTNTARIDFSIAGLYPVTVIVPVEVGGLG